jgi:carboxymethylenebutenolidase
METKMIDYARPDGQAANSYYVTPWGDRKGPGVVLIQEWWGLNAQIKGVADRLGQAGYRAIVPDLFRGKVAKDGNEASHLMSGLDWDDAVDQDIRGAVQHLRNVSDGAVGVMGFCMGGALTIIAGTRLSGIDAGVCFYGIPPAAKADPSRLRVPMQFHFAQDDDWCTPEAVDKLERALEQGSATFEVFRYDAKHAFMNEARPEVHDPAASAKAWERALHFLLAKLREPGAGA